MQAYTLKSHALACFIMALCSVSVNAYTMSEMCAQYPGQGYIGDPGNCQGWGYCRNNQLVQTGTCGKGLLYNTKTAACSYANETPCSTSAASTCNNYKSPVVISDPTNCTQYVYCDGAGGYETGACPYDQVFQASTGTCVWGSGYTCPGNSICELMPNNIFVGDPNNCGKYLQCQNGNGVSTSCGAGYFNTLTGYCQADNPCGAAPGNSGTPALVTPPASNATVCKLFTGTVNTIEFFSDSQTCYGYYVCKNNASPGLWGSCPFGTHFSQKLQKCVSPASVPCPYNRCANVKVAFMANINTSCKEYSNCNNQLTTGNGFCPTNYQYFDEVAGYCVGTEPNYAVCTTE